MSSSSERWGRKLLTYGDKANLPQGHLRKFIRAGKVALNPTESIRYKRQYRELVERNRTSLFVPEDKGYCSIDRYEIEESKPAIEQAQELFETYRRDCDDPELGLQNIIDETQLSAQEDILRLALSDTVLAIAAEYLETVPKLATIHLWWTPVNDKKQGSQLFHLDSLDDRQIKFFFNVKDVTPESGPFACIPSDRTREITDRFNLSYLDAQEMTDEQVFSVCEEGEVITATGKTGAGFATDTSRCLHYGSRKAEADRVLLMIQFTKPFPPKEPKTNYDTEDWSFVPNDPLKQAVLS